MAAEVQLDDPLSHRLRSVLRMRKGDIVVLLDGRGYEYEAVLEDVDGPAVRARVRERRPGLPEPPVDVVLYQSVIKGDRFDWVLEKGTELGVTRFVPIIVERSVVRPSSGPSARGERWQRIVTEAAEQCGRSRLPVVAPVTEIADAFASAAGLCLLPWEEESVLGLRAALRQEVESLKATERPIVSLFIGPEGGFTEKEVRGARSRGVRVVSLGRRILRSETAGIAAVAAVLYELGELGG